MSAKAWERIERLFHQALEHPPEARAAFLDGVCGGEPDLADEVAALLAAHERTGDPASMPSAWLGAVAAPEPSRFTTGDRVAGRYEIRGLLGVGGMGEVYEAWDDGLSIVVALKTFRVPIDTEEAHRRLKMEGFLARSVWHPNVCRLYDLGRHDDERGSAWFLTMERLEGVTLSGRLRDVGRLPLDQARRFAEQLAAALGAAHSAGVVHRDFKPGNVILVNRDGDEQAVVTDFGISRSVSEVETDAKRRGAGLVTGTPAYMAPEQLRGEGVGPAADIYALGTVLYEMVTGRLPFPDGSAIEMAKRRLAEDAPSPRSVVPELDERWEAVVLRCLTREPERRFRRAEEVADALAGRGVVKETEAVQLTTRARHALPLEPDDFVGREEELQELDENLAESRLVTLVGAGGIGKTRLAVRYGWRSLSVWPGGVWLCDLTEARDADAIASSVARSLGVPLKGDPVEQLGQAIAGRGRCLVILDNFEQVVGHAAATVGRWLERAAEARFVVTSREKLTLRGQETVQAVEPLSANAAMELFETRARWLRPGLTLVGSEADAAREIVRLVDGMPLAIELAAARMRVMSAAEIVGQMRKRFQLLTGGRGSRHETLEAAIDGSWELLSPWERVACAQCSVFEGGFTLDAAEAVLDVRTWPEGMGPVDALRSLVDKSLLRTLAMSARPNAWMPEARFGMYVSLQEYARLKLREGEAIPGGRGISAERVAEGRHGKWYAQYGTTESIDALNRHGGISRLRKLEREHQNLVIACHRAMRRGDGATAAATYRAAAEVFGIQGPSATAVELGREVVMKAALEGREKAHLLLALARAERLEGRIAEAVARSEEALALARDAADRSLEATLIGWLGVLNYDQGAREKTRALCEEALAIQRETGDRRLEGVLLSTLGLALRDQGRLGEALENYEAALAIHREVGDRRYEGIVLGFMGSLLRVQGRLKESLAESHAALAIHREVGNRLREGQGLGGLAEVYVEMGLPEKARTHVEAAIAIAREVGDRRSEGIQLLLLADLHYNRGSVEEAHSCTETAIAIHRVFGTREMEAIALGFLGKVLGHEGRLREAREAFIAGEVMLRELQCVYHLANLLCLHGELALESGDHAAARAALSEVETIARQVDSGPNSELARMLDHFRQMSNVKGPAHRSRRPPMIVL